ncbi:MAG TPA: GNAT family N-acetyltransferase [Thermomicrobiales bacterium]|jgi:hypothetical protein|nr:GNAT family N-acetyltransferase [Thermomicrobiales bacterium]
MQAQVQVLTPDDSRWMDVLAVARHDWYQLPAYVSLAAQQAAGDPVAVLVTTPTARLLLPLVLRPLPPELGEPGQRDAISPYGYPGFVVAAPDKAGEGLPNDDAIREALVAAVSWLGDNGIVSVFLRMDPLAPFKPEIVKHLGDVVRHGQTVSIDLTQSPAAIQNGIRSNHRRNIAKLERLGFTFESCSPDDPDVVREFIVAYTENMDRLHADSSYYVDIEYVTRLAAALGPGLTIMRARVAGETVAAALFTEVDGVVQYHLSGTRHAAASMSPNKGMIAAAIHWARDRGNRVLHLGGGVGGAEDALFAFKCGFSDDRNLFWTARIVTDPVVYGDLVSRRDALAGGPQTRAAGYFPAYRAPVPQVVTVAP